VDAHSPIRYVSKKFPTTFKGGGEQFLVETNVTGTTTQRKREKIAILVLVCGGDQLLRVG
jgi:hypothetical protein